MLPLNCMCFPGTPHMNLSYQLVCVFPPCKVLRIHLIGEHDLGGTISGSLTLVSQ